MATGNRARPASETGTSEEEKGTSPAPFRVADAEPGKPSKRGKKQPAAPASPPQTHFLYILFYLPVSPSFDRWLEFLDFPREVQGVPIGPFSRRFQIITRTRPSRALEDLTEALNTPGALVVYMSHTLQDPDKRALGLQPEKKKKKRVLENTELVKRLEKARANVVVLAGCATNTMVTKQLENDIVTITTDSGRNGETLNLSWARAIAAFLFALIGLTFDPQTNNVTMRNSVATINEAIAEANPFFPGGDRFVLASGNGNMILP